MNVFSNFFNNPLFLIILIITIVVQVACVEFGGQSLRTVPLSRDEHLLCLGLGALPILLAPIFKLIIPSSIFAPLSKPSREVDWYNIMILINKYYNESDQTSSINLRAQFLPSIEIIFYEIAVNFALNCSSFSRFFILCTTYSVFNRVGI